VVEGVPSASFAISVFSECNAQWAEPLQSLCATPSQHHLASPLQPPADFADACPRGQLRCESPGLLQAERRTSLHDEGATGRILKPRSHPLGHTPEVPRLPCGGHTGSTRRPVGSHCISHLCRDRKPSLRQNADPGPRPRGSRSFPPEARPSHRASLAIRPASDPHFISFRFSSDQWCCCPSLLEVLDSSAL